MADAQTDRPDQSHPQGAPDPPPKPSPQAGPNAGPDGKPDSDKPGADPPKGDDKPKPKPRPVWPLILAAAIVAVFVIVVLYIIYAPHARVRTDDAYVTAHYAMVSPRVAGQVTGVFVNDNQAVRAGQLLVTLDQRDFVMSLRDAQANLQSDRARVAQAAAQVARQPALIRQAAAQAASVQARLTLSLTDAQRYTNLALTGAGTVQQQQQAAVTLQQDRDSLASAQAELDAQRRQLPSLVADEQAAKARLGADQSRIGQAQLNLSYTRLAAPIDGYIDQRSVQVGDYLSPGAAVMVVVPLNAVFIVASYRELALRHVQPGQPVLIHLDAYNIDLRGRVDSLPPASGATYSPVPPNNATGNFTKIVQRLPVKITVMPGQPLARLLRVGMSVETTIDTSLDDVVAEQRTRSTRVTALGVRR